MSIVSTLPHGDMIVIDPGLDLRSWCNRSRHRGYGYNAGRKQAKILETTFTLEFTSATKDHLKSLEHQLKHIHDVRVDLVEPRDHVAPALVAIEIDKAGTRGEAAAQHVAQVLYNFLHDAASAHINKTIFLVTIEGERTAIEPLSVEQIKGIIIAAREGESA